MQILYMSQTQFKQLYDLIEEINKSLKKLNDRQDRMEKDIKDILKFVPTENANFSLKNNHVNHA